jgi:hypothetical protein
MINKTIGKRISIAEHSGSTTIVIDAKIPPSQQIALEAWFGGWLGLGGLIGYGAYSSKDDEMSVLLVCLVFWSYFFVRILKVILWRRIGKEIIRINDKNLLVKNAFKTKGKDRFYDLKLVGSMKSIIRKETSFLGSLDQSFWLFGGDNIHFNYLGKTHVLGKQLNESDAVQLCNYLNKRVAKFSKKK